MKGKTIAAAGLAFTMALGLSACGQDDPAEEASEQAQEASQSSQYMGGEGTNATSEGAAEQADTENDDIENGTMDPASGGTSAMPEDEESVEDSGTMQGMNEATDSSEPGSEESMSTREGGTAHTATNTSSSGAMTQAEESRNLD